MFEAENQFYEENRETLREKYLGKRVVIVKDQILGVYDTDSEAITETTIRFDKAFYYAIIKKWIILQID